MMGPHVNEDVALLTFHLGKKNPVPAARGCPIPFTCGPTTKITTTSIRGRRRCPNSPCACPRPTVPGRALVLAIRGCHRPSLPVLVRARLRPAGPASSTSAAAATRPRHFLARARARACILDIHAHRRPTLPCPCSRPATAVPRAAPFTPRRPRPPAQFWPSYPRRRQPSSCPNVGLLAARKTAGFIAVLNLDAALLVRVAVFPAYRPRRPCWSTVA